MITNYLFLYIVVVFSLLSFLQNVAYTAGVLNNVMYGVIVYQWMCSICLLILSFRMFGFAWGLLAGIIIVFVLPDTLGFISYFFTKDRIVNVTGFYCLHFYVIVAFTVYSYIRVKKGLFVYFLYKTSFIPLYIITFICIVMFIVRTILKIRYLHSFN